MSDMVGRGRELRLLDGSLAAALEGSGRLVLCSGEPGIGKTRLARELVETARSRGVPSAWGRCTDGEPYGCWQQVVQSCSALVDVQRNPAELAVLTPRPETGDVDQLPEDRFVVFDSAARLMLSAARPAGLVVVIDDVHLADRTSLLLLRHVVREMRQRGGRLLLLVTFRDTDPDGSEGLESVVTDLLAEPCTEQLALRGLDRDAVQALLTHAGGTAVPDAEVARAHRTTGGNPFFVGELGRALRLGTSSGPPRTVRAAIADRLARLPRERADLLRAASVLGSEFHVGVLAQVVGKPALECLSRLDAAAGAGLIQPTDVPGRLRFVHETVRDAIEVDLGATERVRLHRAAALAIERFHQRWIEPHLTRLAHHWSHVAAIGEGDVAAMWASRAAQEAMRRLAFEEAVRLYRLALEVGTAQLDEPAVADLLLGLARGLYRSGDLQACVDACQEGVVIARRLGRPDLIGQAALVLESLGEPRINLVVRDLCREALDGLGDDRPAFRARLLAQLTESWVYLGETDAVETTSLEAIALADHTEDPAAMVAALRARHLAVNHADDTTERLLLADRLEDVARAIPQAEPAMWAELWRIAVRFETGDLPAAAEALPRLARAVERVRTPLARWQLARTSATLAQAQGRFADATRHARQARDLLTVIGHPGAQHQYHAVLCAVGHHIGPPPGLAEEIASFAGAFGPFPDARPLSRALVLLDSGMREAAIDEYHQFSPMTSWRPPWFLARIALALRTLVAVGIENRDDAAALRIRLEPERGRHITGVGGTAVYLGPVELYLGASARLLGQVDDAVADLSRAVEVAEQSGARPHAVEARYELGRALVARAATGDLDSATSVLAEARTGAHALGMTPFILRIERLLTALGGGARSDLSARERQVAALVARGMTNRRIAETLVVSERTAQNHVQHILIKLGFSARAQIAAWVAARDTSE